MERCTECERLLLISFLVAFGGVGNIALAHTESLSTNRLHEDLRSTFCLKERFNNVINLHTIDHDRQKRFIHFRLKVPHEAEFQLKWAILLPVPSEEKYETVQAIEIEWTRPLPSYLADDEYEPPFSTLFGGVNASPEGEPNLTPGHIGERKAKSPRKKKRRKKKKIKRTKRSLHVTDRLGAYEVIRETITKLGLPAKACLLRTICEVSAAPLYYGLIGDFLNLLLTPSVASLSASREDLADLKHYLHAEAAGREGGECHSEFKACPSSVFDLLPLIKHKILDFPAP